MKHRIDVEGSARRSVPADRVLWSLAVVESGDVPAEAFARGGERLDTLTSRLREELGEGADVRTGALSVRPQRDEHGRPLPAVDVSGHVTIDAPLADAGRAAGAAMSAGADRLDGPRLEVRDRAGVEEELLGEAVAAARRKAEQVAAAAGRVLGRVVAVTEDASAFPMGERMSASYGGPDLTPADAEIVATVRVVFELLDG
jgi:uncharacterized protein